MQDMLPSIHVSCAYVYVIAFLFAGVDLSYIVKAIPKISSEESTEDQTHEVLQVCFHLCLFVKVTSLQFARKFTL